MLERRKSQENLAAYLLLAPALVLLGVFEVFPLFFTAFVSLFHWRIRPGHFVGLAHYLEMLGGVGPLVSLAIMLALLALSLRLVRATSVPLRWLGRLLVAALALGLFLLGGLVWEKGDARLLRSLEITFWLALGTVPLQLLLGLSLALALDARFQGKAAFRTILLIPYVIPLVASATVFALVFSLSPDSPANQFLRLLHGGPWQWLRQSQGIFAMNKLPVFFSDWFSSWTSGPSLALICIILFNIWLFSGYYALVFSNGLAAIPKEIYEAAALDGVSKPTLLFRVILPLLSPSTYFLTILGLIGTFKTFSSVYILRNTATAGAVDPTSVYIFMTFFRDVRYGYAATLAVVLFLIILFMTNVQRRLWEKRVFYE